VIPAKFDRRVVVNTQALIGSLRRAELVAGDRASMVKLEVANQTLMITAKSTLPATPTKNSKSSKPARIWRSRSTPLSGRNPQPRRLAANRLEFLGPLSPAAIRPSKQRTAPNSSTS